jgi:pimeloyl-ACP methyl ester carboxylesterase
MASVKSYEVSTSHARIAVAETRGGEPPLLLIHGNSLSTEVFRAQFDFFGDRRRVIGIDLPGHGQSSNAVNPERTYSLVGYADSVAELLSLIGVDRAVVLGWSLGGHIGLEMTARYPGLVGLMMIGAPPFVRSPVGLEGYRPNPKLAFTGMETLTEAQIDEFVRLVTEYERPPDPAWRAAVARADGLARRTVFEALSSYEPTRQRDLAEHCRVPLAMVNGSADQFVDVDYVASLNYRNLWLGQAHVFAGLGHAIHLHAPDQFNSLLEQFLLDVDASTTRSFSTSDDKPRIPRGLKPQPAPSLRGGRQFDAPAEELAGGTQDGLLDPIEGARLDLADALAADA